MPHGRSRSRNRANCWDRSPGGGTPPTPPVPPGASLVLYLDGADITGEIGDPISTWVGRVGGNATQMSSGNSPAVLEWTPGIQAARFRGADYLRTAVVPATGSSGRTLFVVLRDTGISGFSYDHVLQYGMLDTQRAYGITSVTALFTYWGNDRYNGFMRSTTLVDTAPYVVCVGYDGATDRLWLNGTLIVQEVIALNTGGDSGVVIGGRLDGMAEFAQTDVVAVAAYNTFLGSAERQDVEEFLGNRFGIAVGP